MDNSIVDAELELAKSPLGTLPLGCRLRIWSEMNHFLATTAHWRRVLINLVTVERFALPKWDECFHGELYSIPRRYLGCCGKLLHREMSQDRARVLMQRNSSSHDFCDQEDSDGDRKKFIASFAAFASQQAAWVAARDEFCLDSRAASVADLLIHPEPEDWDAHYICSIIVAGGAECESEGSSELRREYWRSWLNEVVSKVVLEPSIESLSGSYGNLIARAAQYVGMEE